MDKRSFCGIYGGRFQIIHCGHEAALQEINKRFEHICIGIINPDPQNPPCDNRIYIDKYDINDNPLTYFQRVYLMDMLLRYNGIRAVIVPHWHALDKEFVPFSKNKRKWFIPNLRDESQKREALINAREQVDDWSRVNQYLQNINSSELRRFYKDHDEKGLKKGIPEIIYPETINFLISMRNGCQGIDEEFIIIPIVGDELHPQLICGGMQLSVKYAKRLLFLPLIQVPDNNAWKEDDYNVNRYENVYFTFYQIHEMINEIMDSLKFFDYLVSPLIIEREHPFSIDSFLPNNRCWLWIEDVNYSLRNPEITNGIRRLARSDNYLKAKIEEIPDGFYNMVSTKLFYMMDDRNYYENREEKIRGDRIMNGQNSSGQISIGNVGGDVIFDNGNGSVQGDKIIGKEVKKINEEHQYGYEEAIVRILKADHNSVKSLLDEADALFLKKTKFETEEIVQSVVKENVDTEQKKEKILDMLKMSSVNVATNFIAGILVQVISRLVF